jgi:hypothetical protein
MTDTQIYDLISKKDKDTLLFNLAKHKNKLIKQELVGYQRTVNTKRQQRKLLLPFTQILFAPRHTIIRLEKYIRGEIPLSSAQ